MSPTLIGSSVSADEFGFDWISDSAEAMGSTRDGKHAGKGARFAIYSFNGNKIITTSGGGALASEDPAVHSTRAVPGDPGARTRDPL